MDTHHVVNVINFPVVSRYLVMGQLLIVVSAGIKKPRALCTISCSKARDGSRTTAELGFECLHVKIVRPSDGIYFRLSSADLIRPPSKLSNLSAVVVHKVDRARVYLVWLQQHLPEASNANRIDTAFDAHTGSKDSLLM